MDEQFQDLFKIRRNRQKVEMGNILIAEPFLEGKYFSRSVIFMVEHDKSGSVGFVLNKPMPYRTSELVTELAGIDFPVYVGGPVETGQLYYLHAHPELEDALHVAHGIYWGGDFAMLTWMLREKKIKEDEIRFFAGYSGWGKGQLESELEENSWMVGDITRERFFGLSDEDSWERSMSELGERYRIWANFPQDPMVN
ncbi:MAG: YqgE/AlgH family protein [Odoribacter sp.]|nr:YqgE/AlgH family protein [Odoribacter sp.]